MYHFLKQLEFSPQRTVTLNIIIIIIIIFLAHQHKACRQLKIKQEMTAVGD